MSDISESIDVTKEMIEGLENLIHEALVLERLTGKTTGITSLVGEMLVCYERNLNWVVNDINSGHDATDSDGKRVQIKARRVHSRDGKNERAGQKMGIILDKNFNVNFDYLIFIFLEKNYKKKDSFRVDGEKIQNYFDQKNIERVNSGKPKVKTASISTIKNLQGKLAS